MTSGLAWIIRACLFQVCLCRACLCEEPDCMYNEYLTEMVESLPKDYLFKVNKSEETVERVEKALSRFYGENCKKDFKCEHYNNYYSAVCYLLGCLDGKEPKCVSNVTYGLGEVELISLKGFKCLVKDAFDHKYNSLQDKACDAVFVDAVRCQKATTYDTKTTTIYTTKLHTINYTTSSIPPKTSTSTVTTTTQPPSSSQEKRLQREVISVSTLLAISLIANIILLLGVVYLWTRGRRQHEGLSPAMPELAVLNAVEVHSLMQNGNGDPLQH